MSHTKEAFAGLNHCVPSVISGDDAVISLGEREEAHEALCSATFAPSLAISSRYFAGDHVLLQITHSDVSVWLQSVLCSDAISLLIWASLVSSVLVPDTCILSDVEGAL